MFCKNCYTDLTGAPEGKCPECDREFDSTHPRTYLSRPFPRTWTIVGQIVLTTALAAIVALVVAFHQLNRTSGH